MLKVHSQYRKPWLHINTKEKERLLIQKEIKVGCLISKLELIHSKSHIKCGHVVIAFHAHEFIILIEIMKQGQIKQNTCKSSHLRVPIVMPNVSSHDK